MTVLLTKMKTSSPETLELIRSKVRKDESKYPSPALMGMTGMGLGSDRVALWLSESYSEYAESVQWIKQHPLVEVDSVSGFIVNLAENHFMPLTFSNLAMYLERRLKNKSSRS